MSLRARLLPSVLHQSCPQGLWVECTSMQEKVLISSYGVRRLRTRIGRRECGKEGFKLVVNGIGFS